MKKKIHDPYHYLFLYIKSFETPLQKVLNLLMNFPCFLITICETQTIIKFFFFPILVQITYENVLSQESSHNEGCQCSIQPLFKKRTTDL